MLRAKKWMGNGQVGPPSVEWSFVMIDYCGYTKPVGAAAQRGGEGGTSCMINMPDCVEQTLASASFCCADVAHKER